ncbi:hypothetical protein L195_g011889 [Trifolium pratense]|uniref:Uncharacterized protein n=1 Tax=Trifolium pratense TaxID=57577 RepID=A0A2K3PIS9_TRIPR|nr:hypothetical protein L195_g011889 [Trifolium pratense]
MRKIRILYSDPYATDYSSEEEELILRNDYQLNGSKKIVKEIFVPFMPLAYDNKNIKKNAFEDVKEVLMFQTSPSSVLDVTVTDTKAAKDINDINGLVKKEDIKEFTSGGKGVCNKEAISIQYMQEEPNVASLVGHDLYFLDEMEMLFGDGVCNLLESDEINCGSMWKVEHDKGCTILPHIDCDFNDTELGWIDETLNWDCH